MNVSALTVACLVICISCSQQPIRPKHDEIEGMNVE